MAGADGEWVAGVQEVLDGDEAGSLDLCDAGLGEEGCIKLAEMIESAPDKVMSIFAIGADINAAGMARLGEALAKVPELRMVDVSNNPEIGVEGAKSIAKLINESPSMENLVAGGCAVGDEGAALIAEALSSNVTVGRLNLPDSDIGDEGLKALAAMFKENSTVGAVVLDNNPFGPEGMAAFGEAFAASETIEMLRLAGVTSEGAIAAFAEAGLATNKGCYELCLADCGMGPEAMGAVATALATNGVVVDLDISSNPDAGPEGAAAIAEMLGTNATIESLTYDGCGAGPEGGAALVEAFKASETLSGLSMEDNEVGEEVQAAMEEAMGAKEE